MPDIPLIALEILVGFGVPLAWGVWQLISLRREKARDAVRAAEQAMYTAPPSDGTGEKATPPR